MVDALLMKQVADTVPMTTWSRTLYNVRPLQPCPHRYFRSGAPAAAGNSSEAALTPRYARVTLSQSIVCFRAFKFR